MNVFTFHTDPGHGWLEVPMSLLRDLGIADKISSYSYMRGDSAYLEEDCDAGLFVRAFLKRFGSRPDHTEAYTHNAPMRSYRRYSAPQQ